MTINSMQKLTVLLSTLEKIDHIPQKWLGQNFLVDQNILNKIIEFSEIKPSEKIVEIGPGLGTLTRELLLAGGNVFAIEKDKKLAKYLSENLCKEFSSNFDLLIADAIDFPLANLPKIINSQNSIDFLNSKIYSQSKYDNPLNSNETDSSKTKKDSNSFKIIANLPYAISTPWLSSVLNEKVLPERMVLMLQKEIVSRLTAKHKTKQMSAVTIILNCAFECKKRHEVSNDCFYPKPKITSEIVVFELRKNPVRFDINIREWIRFLFLHRRKQLGNLLNMQPVEWKDLFLSVLAKFGESEKNRPEEISIETWKNFAIEYKLYF